MDLGKSKRRGLCCPPSVSIVVLFSFSFFFFFNFYFSLWSKCVSKKIKNLKWKEVWKFFEKKTPKSAWKLRCCSNHSPEQHLWYADFSKALSRLSSSGDYKRTRQGALAVLIFYIYYRLLVHATIIITCPYVHVLSSCPITHPHMFFLRPLCFLHVPWCHTLNLCYTCVHHEEL